MAPDGIVPVPAPGGAQQASAVNSHVKVYMGFCVERCLVSQLYTGSGEGGMWG